jgi:hypothetical protein
MARQKHLHVPVIGDTILADGWRGIVEMLREGDKPVDSGYPGCQFRVTWLSRVSVQSDMLSN